MQNWKENRFITAGPELGLEENLIILTDISFWYKHYEELKNWCEENDCQQSGMTVVIPTKELLTIFCLRWG